MPTSALKTTLHALTVSFTDAVMDAIRSASLEDLLGQASRGPGRSTGVPSTAKVARAESSAAQLGRHSGGHEPPNGVRVGARRSGLSAAAATDPAPSPSQAPPAPAAEITDPQGLLSMGTQESRNVAPPEIARERVPEGPASAVRAVEASSPVRLRANETLARVSNAGVVIRRAK
jgi:hypothetical protein